MLLPLCIDLVPVYVCETTELTVKHHDAMLKAETDHLHPPTGEMTHF